MTATYKRLTLRLIGILAVGLLLRLCLNQNGRSPFSTYEKVPNHELRGPLLSPRFRGDKVGFLTLLQGTGI
jgi:hypothetical protein